MLRLLNRKIGSAGGADLPSLDRLLWTRCTISKSKVPRPLFIPNVKLSSIIVFLKQKSRNQIMEPSVESRESTEDSRHSNDNSQDSELNSKKSDDGLPSNIIDEDEVDSETMKKMKGDAIGDTLYSERFVLKALMELKEQNGKKIEESFEKDICLVSFG